MYNFHLNRLTYFKTQIINTEKSLIPFIELSTGDIKSKPRVLEVGCAEGGVLKAFVNKGCRGTGIELDHLRVTQAKEYLSEDIAAGNIRIIQGDIFNPGLAAGLDGQFDLIILKDVIEHIHDKNRLLSILKSCLAPYGFIFIGFPPWRMPFGGHQQICCSKILSRLPWFHLLPAIVYKKVLTVFGENPDYLMDIRQTGISIAGFEKLVKRTGCKIASSQLYLISPIYEHKFGIKPVKQSELLAMVPYIKDFFTTSTYYLLKPADIDS